ncbi:hypothetical protein Xbed_00576 [Xenorhabdus beddingii]|uniref:Uncharacterized protein n=1 Tax=Xenorhabdus beddingii TaxID=40578 RepID=A0A1Y2STT3_9GAMM|nr:hypothetical protein [Xenorhabdus beddingii]OTA21347.1 hypothetical protein Xbed_00576 [Xenorhabdus beddingii]
MKQLIKKWFNNTFGIVEVDSLPVERLPALCYSLLEKKLNLLDSTTIKDVGFLDSINSRECHFSPNINRMRKQILFPIAVGFILGFVFFINNFVKKWNANENALIEYVENTKRNYGSQFFLDPKAPEHIKSLKIISNSKDISLFKYFYIRYSKDSIYGEERSRRYFIFEVGGGLSLLIINIILLYFVFLHKKPADFIIDRKKKIFYSWRKGRVYVSRYSELGIINKNNIIRFEVYGLNKENKLMSCFFVPSISMLNSIEYNNFMLKFMSKYLLQGKESVSSVDFKRREILPWLRKDLRPEDWESQISAILAELDRLGPPGMMLDSKTQTEQSS